MTIEQIQIEENVGIEQASLQLKRLAEDDHVYILFNRYDVTRRLYANSKYLNPEDLRFEDCWRLKLFKDYYSNYRERISEENQNPILLEEEFIHSIKTRFALIRIND